MDGIHDLGGKQGFGPIAVTESDPAFHEPWEGRLFAITQSVGDRSLSIDWFRNLIELMEPRSYLNEPYFQRWYFAMLTGLVQAGTFSIEEALGQGAEERNPPPPPMTLRDALARDRADCFDYSRPVAAAPRHAPGDVVRTRTHMQASHTRLPGYARGRQGSIIAHHGAHLLPDEGAMGRELAEHLYTVEFDAAELWGEEGQTGDTVTLDLWESYLVDT